MNTRKAPSPLSNTIYMRTHPIYYLNFYDPPPPTIYNLYTYRDFPRNFASAPNGAWVRFSGRLFWAEGARPSISVK